MRRIIYSALIVLALFVLYKILFPVYRITHFYPKNNHGLCVVTSVERIPFLGSGKIYFTEGYFDRKEIPLSYIRPYSKGFSGCWTSHLWFRNDTAYYLEGWATTEVKGNFKRLVFVKNSFTDYKELLKAEAMSNEMNNDKSGNVYHFFEYPADR